MFGNIWGWLMSVVIVAFTTAIIIIGGVPGAITKPTKALPAALQSAALGVEPAVVLPPGTESCNAGQAYRDAAAKFSQRDMKKKVKAYLYEKDSKKKKAAAAALHADLEPLLNARNCSKMDLYTSKPEQVLNYENEKPELARIESLGNLLVAIGGFYSKDDPAKCRQYMEAALAMGRNLYQERVCFEEYRIGVAIISNSSAQLARFGTDPSDTARVAQLNSLKTEADKALSKAGPTWAGVSGIGTEPDGRLRFTGDMFDIAK